MSVWGFVHMCAGAQKGLEEDVRSPAAGDNR